jgi:hypothetical protein
LAEYATRRHASAYGDDGNDFSSILRQRAARGATLTIRVSIRFDFTGRDREEARSFHAGGNHPTTVDGSRLIRRTKISNLQD